MLDIPKENIATVSQNPGKTLSEHHEIQNNISSTVKEWDKLCFQAIIPLLAPRGFKESTNKHWRGLVVADIPHLSKKKADQVAKTSASLVRGYRENLKKELKDQLRTVELAQMQWAKRLDESQWYKFSHRKMLRQSIAEQEQVRLKLLHLIVAIENIPIK